MRITLLLVLTTIAMSMSGQNTYSDPNSYREGKLILKNAQKQIEESNGNKSYVDYWNLALAYALMGREKDTVLKHLIQCKEASPGEFYFYCQFSVRGGKDIEETIFYEILKNDFITLINEAKEELDNFGVAEQEKVENITNEKVVNKLKGMMRKDERYRSHDDFFINDSIQQLQIKLDEENVKSLESLFRTYGYPGKSVVGDNVYQDYACIIVIHMQSLKKQKAYLEIIAKALNRNELNKAPVRILIDRIHWRETGTQIFGSQVGVPFTNDEEIQKTKKKYGL